MRPPRISAYEPQVLERQQHSLADMLAIPAPDACTRWLRGDRGNADSVSSIMRLLVALLGVLLSLLRPMEGHHGYASTALGWSICATGASAASHVEAPARLVAQHQNPAKKRTVLAHTIESRLSAIQRVIRFKAAGDEPWPWDGGPAASRHRGQQRARGEKLWNVPRWSQLLVTKS